MATNALIEYMRNYNTSFLRAMREDTVNILKLEKAFTVAELTAAYRRQSLLVHPDKCGVTVTGDGFIRLKNIYDANLSLFSLLSVSGSAFPYDAVTCLSICLEKRSKPLFYILLGINRIRTSRWFWQMCGIVMLLALKCSAFRYR